MNGASPTRLAVPAERIERWVANFEARHGRTTFVVQQGALRGRAVDGSTFAARLPFETGYDDRPAPTALVEACAGAVPEDWGVLLVRKGGFAIARMAGTTMRESKTGQRHVQGRTKAGGQSQQRFARRRDNQTRQAYEAAADHAARVLAGLAGPVVAGGDRPAVEEVLADARLRDLRVIVPWLPVPDPRRSVLEQAVRDACALQLEVVNA